MTLHLVVSPEDVVGELLISERTDEMDQMMIAQKASEWLSVRLQVPPKRAESLGQEFAAYLSTAETSSNWEGLCQYCGEPARGRGSTLCWFHYTASLRLDAETSVESASIDKVPA
jgi:hypothetical protein